MMPLLLKEGIFCKFYEGIIHYEKTTNTIKKFTDSPFDSNDLGNRLCSTK